MAVPMNSPLDLNFRGRWKFLLLPPTGRLLCLVLLIAIRDRASRVLFEQVHPGNESQLLTLPGGSTAVLAEEYAFARHGCRLRYVVGGVRHDLVPAPIPAAAIARHWHGLTNPLWMLLANWLLRRGQTANQVETPDPVRIMVRGREVGRVRVRVRANAGTVRWVAFDLCGTTGGAESAAKLLKKYLRSKR